MRDYHVYKDICTDHQCRGRTAMSTRTHVKRITVVGVNFRNHENNKILHPADIRYTSTDVMIGGILSNRSHTLYSL